MFCNYMKGILETVKIESIIIMRNSELGSLENDSFPIRPIEMFTDVYIVCFEGCHLTS